MTGLVWPAVGAALLVLDLAVPRALPAAFHDVVIVGAFSTASEGADLPPEWEPLTFDKVPRTTTYTIVRDDDRTVVRADSRAGASGLTRAVSIDLAEYPVVAWRWKVENVVAKGDLTKKSGDDYAARLYITFAYEPDKVGWTRRLKYRAGRLLFGDIPIAAINYIWDRSMPIETVAPNAYTDFVQMIVVESGSDNVNRWIDEERNVYADYRHAFGEEPPRVNGVAIMSDTDNTGEAVTAYYGDIMFRRAK